MSANEMVLRANGEKDVLIGNRTLGVLGMIGAPLLLAEFVLRAANVLPGDTDNAWVGLLEMLYIGGWTATAIGMRRLRATGDGTASRMLFIIQMIGLSAAFLVAAQILFGATYRDENVSWFFKITDLGFPFSHLLMIVVGVFVWRAKVWLGWLKFAPFAVGIILLLLMADLGAFLEMAGGAFVFGGSTAINLFSLAYGVYRGVGSEKNIGADV